MDVNQVYFIGHNKYGQAGLGQQSHNKKYQTPKSIIYKKFIKQISCGNHHSALLTIDGLVYTMGSNIHGTLGLGNKVNINYAFKPTLIKQFKQIDKIFSGSYHMCAIKQGQLYSWGKGIDGQLGHGNSKNLFIPTKIQAFNNQVENVSCGLNHTLVIIKQNQTKKSNGYAFGNGIYGQLGSGSTRNYNIPINVKLNSIQFLSAGENHSLFISKGEIYGCGDNTSLQLGQLQILNNNESNKNKKLVLQPKKIQFNKNSNLQNKFVTIHSSTLSVALTQQGNSYVWGGINHKIWPPKSLQSTSKIIDTKANSEKVFVLTSSSQIYSYNFKTLNNETKINKQQILLHKNILDFDVADAHLMIIGDIIGNIQGQSQALEELQYIQQNEMMKSTNSQLRSYQLSKQHSRNSLSLNKNQSNKSNSFLKQFKYIQQSRQQYKMPTYITKNLQSGKSSYNCSLSSQIDQKKKISEKQLKYDLQDTFQINLIKNEQNEQNKYGQNNRDLDQFNISDSCSFPHLLDKKQSNESSQIQYQNNIQKLSNEQISIKKQKVKNSKILKESQKLQRQNIPSIQSSSSHNKKLQRLMQQMQLKTIHLKKYQNQQLIKKFKYYDQELINNNKKEQIFLKQKQKQFKNDFFSMNKITKSVQIIHKEQNLIKTPSSQIKMETQKFILSSNQTQQQQNITKFQTQIYQNNNKINNKNNQFILDNQQGKYQTKNFRNQIYQQNKLSQIHYEQIKNIFIKQNQNNVKKNKHLQKLALKNLQQNNQIKKNQQRQNNIQVIFQQLLRKHNKNKQNNEKTKQKWQNTLKQKNKSVKSSYYQVSPVLNKSQKDLKCQKSLTRPRSIVEKNRSNQKIPISSFNQNYLQNENKIQNNANINYDDKLDKLAISKLSTHSNISSKTNFKRNSQLFQISRSNRQLRFQLRKRDLKISQLQQNLSKKQMQLQILYAQFQKYKQLHSPIQQNFNNYNKSINVRNIQQIVNQHKR